MAGPNDILAQAAQPATNPFDNVTPEPAQYQPSTQTDDQITKTAGMATLSNNPVLDNISASIEANRQVIKNSGDMSLRYRAAALQQQDSVQALSHLVSQAPKFDPTGQIAKGATLAIQSAVSENLDRRAEYAMEQRAIGRLQDLAMTDPTQAAVISENIIKPGAEGVINDIATKKAIIAREVEKAGVAVEHQGWLKSAVDFAAGLIDPFMASSQGGNYNDPNVVKHWYDWILGGERQKSKASNLWALPAADFAKAIREQVVPGVYKNSTLLGYTDNTKALDLLNGMNKTDPVWQTNVQDAINAATFLPALKVEKLLDIPYLFVRTGNRKALAQTLAGVTVQGLRDGMESAAKEAGMTTQDVLDNIRPQVVNEGTPASSVTVTGNALDAIDRAKLLSNVLDLSTGPGRATEEEVSQHLNKMRQTFQEDTGRELKDWKVNEVPVLGGAPTYQAEYMVGKAKGDGFSSATQAKRWADANGYAAEQIQHDSGMWFNKITRDIPEVNGMYQLQVKPGLKNTGIAGRFLLGARQTEDDLLGSWARVSGNNRAKVVKQFVDQYSDQLRGLSRTQRDTLGAVLSWGERQGVWLSDDELGAMYKTHFGRDITANERTAYRVMHDINDIEYGFRNDVEYKTRVVKGYETGSFDHPLIPGGTVDRMNMLIDREPTKAPLGRLYDATTDQHVLNPAQDYIQSLSRDNKVIVSLETPVDLVDGTTVKHFVVDKSNLVAEPLRRDQLAYRAGGHRMYSDKYFVKQAVYGVQKDTGEQLLKNPNTYITGTQAEVQKWAKVMEQARQSYKAGLTDPDKLTDILAPLGYMDGETFLKYMQDGTFQKDTPFTPVFDRELPHEYVTTPHAAQFTDSAESGVSGWLRTNGRMYYSSKGAPLLDWKGNLAPTIDPFEVANTALMNVANLASWSDYKISAVERWVDTYRPYLNLEALPPGASKYTIFSDAKMASSVDKLPLQGGDKVKQAMESQRDIIRRNIGWRSDWDAQVDMHAERLASWIMGDDPESLQHSAGQAATEWWNENKPLRALRGLAFDMKMGFFNVAQLPLQIQTILATAALEPGKAFAAMGNLIPMRVYLTRSGTDHMLDYLVQNGAHTLAGFEADEYKQMMKAAKTSGFFDFGGTHQMIDQYGPRAAYGGARYGWDQFTRAGRFFFNEGEVWNRIVAWQTAWKDVAESMPAYKVGGRDFMNNVALRADDFSMNMSEQSRAAWQTGSLAIPTQFWAYNARMMEAIGLPGTKNQFTGMQRLRLFLAQTFFYGAAGGTPIGMLASQTTKTLTGTASPDPQKKALDTFWGAFDRGAFDEAIYHMSGADVLAGQRYGQGPNLVNTAAELFGLSAYGEKSFADVMGGATYTIMTQTGKQGFHTIADLVRYVTAESGARDYPLFKDDFANLAQQISTLSYANKAYLGWRYHLYQTTSESIPVNGLPTSDAFYFAMGMSPGEMDQVNAQTSFLKLRGKNVDEAARLVGNLRTQWVNEPDNRRDIEARINALMQLYPEDIRVSILKKVQRQMPLTVLDSLNRQMAKDRAMAAIADDNGPTNDNP